jgi:molecular chaperone HtpG
LETTLDEQTTNDLSLVIFEQATLSEGLQLDDPVGFVTRINQFIH